MIPSEEDPVLPAGLGHRPRLLPLMEDLLDVLDGHPWTPEGIELYDPHVAQDDLLYYEFAVYDGIGGVASYDDPLPAIQPTIRRVRVFPEIMDVYRGVYFTAGWNEGLRKVVFWLPEA